MITDIIVNNTSAITDTLAINSFMMNKKTVVISSKEALSDVIPIQWESDVINNVKKVVLIKPKRDTEE